VVRRTLPIQTQNCIGKYVTSHTETFLVVSVPTAERTASELAGGARKKTRRVKRAVKGEEKEVRELRSQAPHRSALGSPRSF